MFQNLQKLCLQSTSEPLLVARSANGIGATIVCESKSGADWMKSKGCKTITVSDLESEDFDPTSIDPKTPIIFTTKALKALADQGEYYRNESHDKSALLAREEDRHKDTQARLEVCIKHRDAAEESHNKWKDKAIRHQDLNEKLVEQNQELLRMLIRARLPWWKKWFGKKAVVASCLVLAMFATGCDGQEFKTEVKESYCDIYTYSFDGCTYIGIGSNNTLIHSATCSNPKHGGVLKCN